MACNSHSFLDKFSLQARIPGANDTLLRSKDTNQLVLLKQMQVQTGEDEQTIATLEYQKKLSHEQLLSLVDYYPQPNTNKIMVLYEYCAISLQQQFDIRLSEERYFQESQLWSIFTSLAFGLAYLQEQNVGHGSLSLFDCFLNEQGFIKVSDPTCASSNPYTIVKGYYYSPQIMRCLISETGQQISIFKSDVFALGCCMLKLTLMRDIDELFDYQNGDVDKRSLQYLIQEIRTFGLSKEYVSFINQMLILDSCQRPDFLSLQAQIFSVLSLDSDMQSHQSNLHTLDIRSSISSMRKSTNQSQHKDLQKNQSSSDILNKRQETFTGVHVERKPLAEFCCGNLQNSEKDFSLSKTFVYPKTQIKSDSEISFDFKQMSENSFFVNPEKSTFKKLATAKTCLDLQSSGLEFISLNLKKLEIQKDFEKLDFGHKKKRTKGQKYYLNPMKTQLDLGSSFQTYCSKISKNSSKTNNTCEPFPQTTALEVLTLKSHKTEMQKPLPTVSPLGSTKQTKEFNTKNYDEDYSDPGFLRMMRAEMTQILNKRELSY